MSTHVAKINFFGANFFAILLILTSQNPSSSLTGNSLQLEPQCVSNQVMCTLLLSLGSQAMVLIHLLNPKPLTSNCKNKQIVLSKQSAIQGVNVLQVWTSPEVLQAVAAVQVVVPSGQGVSWCWWKRSGKGTTHSNSGRSQPRWAAAAQRERFPDCMSNLSAILATARRAERAGKSCVCHVTACTAL